MHFWDAPDHISKANFNLVLENNRMYFQNAAGYFGALPLVISGTVYPLVYSPLKSMGSASVKGIWMWIQSLESID